MNQGVHLKNLIMKELSELARFLRERRQAISEDCHAFWENHRHRIGVEFSAYRNYENGNRTPDVDFLKRIAPILKVETRILCHLWARAKMPCNETREFFEAAPGYFPKIPLRARGDDVYRFGRSDIRYLEKYPELFPIAALMATGFCENEATLPVVARAVGLSRENALIQLRTLEDLGIVREGSKNCFRSNYRDVSIRKDDPAFDAVRNKIYQCFFSLLMRNFSMEKKQKQLAHRFSFTFRPTETNVKIIHTKLQEVESLLQQITDEGEKSYSVMVLFSDVLDLKSP